MRPAAPATRRLPPTVSPPREFAPSTAVIHTPSAGFDSTHTGVRVPGSLPRLAARRIVPCLRTNRRNRPRRREPGAASPTSLRSMHNASIADGPRMHNRRTNSPDRACPHPGDSTPFVLRRQGVLEADIATSPHRRRRGSPRELLAREYCGASVHGSFQGIAGGFRRPRFSRGG